MSKSLRLFFSSGFKEAGDLFGLKGGEAALPGLKTLSTPRGDGSHRDNHSEGYRENVIADFFFEKVETQRGAGGAPLG